MTNKPHWYRNNWGFVMKTTTRAQQTPLKV